LRDRTEFGDFGLLRVGVAGLLRAGVTGLLRPELLRVGVAGLLRMGVAACAGLDPLRMDDLLCVEFVRLRFDGDGAISADPVLPVLVTEDALVRELRSSELAVPFMSVSVCLASDGASPWDHMMGS